MAKPKNIIPSRKICILLPETEAARLDLYLFSESEGRVPMGAYRELMLKTIKEIWEFKLLDLSPYTGSPPGAFILKGDKDSIEQLTKLLESK